MSTFFIQLCPTSLTAVSADDLPAVQPDTASSTVLQETLTAKIGAAGEYAVYIVDSAAGKTYDSGKKLTITSTDDKKYVACSGPGNAVKPDANLGCSFNPLSHEVAYEIFGKGVANRFVAVQVTVRNKNPNFEYLLQDVRLGQSGLVLSSYDKKIPRAVSEKEEQFSARAIIIRLTAAAASVVTGVAGFAGNELLQDAANIFAGPAQTGLQGAIPNLSASELTRMDDLGFSVSSTVIPKSSAIPVVAFISSETLDRKYSKYKQGKQLNELFSSLKVSVAGTHVQETNPSQPTLKLFIPPSGNTVALSQLKANPVSFVIEGSGLDGVKQVQLSSSDGKTVLSASLVSLQSGASVDPNVASLTVPASANAISGTYSITFVLSGGTNVKTDQNVIVTP